MTTGAFLYVHLLIVVERWWFRFRCPSRVVGAAEYGNDWPLTVNSAILCCKYGAVWLEVCGKKYGLNGFATTLLISRGHTSFDLAEIWKDAPDVEGIKMSTKQLFQDGLALERS